MKKLFILAALGICGTAMAENTNDTVTVEQPQSVEIISTESGTTVNILGRKGEPDYQYSHSLTTPPTTTFSTRALTPTRGSSTSAPSIYRRMSNKTGLQSTRPPRNSLSDGTKPPVPPHKWT